MTHDVFKKKPLIHSKLISAVQSANQKACLIRRNQSTEWSNESRIYGRCVGSGTFGCGIDWYAGVNAHIGRVGAALSSSFKQQDARVGVRSSAAEYFYFFRCVADAHCSECPRWRFCYVPWRAVIVLCRCQDGRSRPLRLSTTTPLDTPAIKRFITDWHTRLLPSWRHLRPFKYFHLQVRHFQVNNHFESILIEFSTFNRILTELADRWR